MREIVFRYGFKYFNKIYCWKNKKLYRMPFNNHQRWHSMRELKLIINGSTLGYCIDRKFKSMKSLKELTEPMNYSAIANNITALGIEAKILLPQKIVANSPTRFGERQNKTT